MDDRRLRFGDRLRTLREKAGPTGRQFAERNGWQASKVSKIETGKQLPSDSDLTVWLSTAGVGESLGTSLREELRALRLEYSTWKRQLRHGFKDRQNQFAETENEASVIRAVELSAVPGLVQTAEYAGAVFEANARFHQLPQPLDIEEAKRARLLRQNVLYVPGKTIEILVVEAALRYPVGSARVMHGQIDRLLALTGSSIRFGVISLDTVLPVIPMHGYWIIDDTVLVETVSGEITERDPEQVALYNRLTDELWEVALEREHARRLLVELADRWAMKAREEKQIS